MDFVMSFAIHSRGPHGSGQFHVMEPVLKLITHFTQLIEGATDACTVTFTSYCKKKVRDMDMNLVLWI